MSEDVVLRRALERAILVALVEECDRAGFVPVTVWDGGCYEPQGEDRARNVVPRQIGLGEVVDAVFAVDEATVHFAPAARCDEDDAWGRLGVLVIGGNGRDFISDWACGDASFSAAVDRACRRVEKLEVTLGV